MWMFYTYRFYMQKYDARNNFKMTFPNHHVNKDMSGFKKVSSLKLNINSY